MMMHVKFTMGAVVLTLLIGMSGAADARGQFQLRIDKDGVQFGGSLDPRQHGYEHAYRDGADRGRFDREAKRGYTLQDNDYLSGARGYERAFGDKTLYMQGYRDG